MDSNGTHAIMILGSGLRKKSNEKWVTTDFGLENSELADNLRVRAAHYLYQENRNTVLIASGALGPKNQGIPGMPHVCDVTAGELVDLGVNSEDILKEDRSKNTHEELQELKKNLKEYGFTKVTILTNNYHLPRTRAFIENDAELSRLLASGRIILQSAEEGLLDREPETWKRFISEVYQSEAMRQRIQLEQKGVDDLRAGKYLF